MGTEEVRDAIHGLITFTPEEWDVINSAPFQRLRRIQQLAMTHLVYPGARHSRFEHSLGAAHVAGRICRGLQERAQLSDDDALKVRAAALVHDVGHGPFSHISEAVFRLPDTPETRAKKGVHEHVSAAILRSHDGIRGALGSELADETADLLIEQGAAGQRSLVRDMVAGPADVDKFDYLLRDSHYCGVKYGEYDLHKIAESIRVFKEAGNRELVFHEGAIYALEGLLLARHHMHRQVYGHKTRLGTDLMLRRAMEMGVEGGLLDRAVFQPATLGPEFVDAFLTLDDNQVMGKLCAEPTSPAGQIMLALQERKLMKRVARVDQQQLAETDQFDAISSTLIFDKDNLNREAITEAEQQVAENLQLDAIWVSFYWDTLKNPIGYQYSLSLSKEDIALIDDRNKRRKFSVESELFGETEQKPKSYLSLYVRPKGDVTPNQAELDEMRRVFVKGLERLKASATAV